MLKRTFQVAQCYVQNPHPVNVGDEGSVCSIPGSERSPGEGNDNPFQYSCLEHSIYRGAIVHEVAESDKTECLSLTPIQNKKLRGKKKREKPPSWLLEVWRPVGPGLLRAEAAAE